MTRQPAIFAICPAALPTAPAAPETKTVSPSCGLPISNSPCYAVKPGHAEDAERSGHGRELRVDLPQPGSL